MSGFASAPASGPARSQAVCSASATNDPVDVVRIAERQPQARGPASRPDPSRWKSPDPRACRKAFAVGGHILDHASIAASASIRCRRRQRPRSLSSCMSLEYGQRPAPYHIIKRHIGPHDCDRLGADQLCASGFFFCGMMWTRGSGRNGRDKVSETRNAPRTRSPVLSAETAQVAWRRSTRGPAPLGNPTQSHGLLTASKLSWPNGAGQSQAACAVIGRGPIGRTCQPVPQAVPTGGIRFIRAPVGVPHTAQSRPKPSRHKPHVMAPSDRLRGFCKSGGWNRAYPILGPGLLPESSNALINDISPLRREYQAWMPAAGSTAL